MSEKSPEFYKTFYEKNRIKILQYDSLRKNFQKMVTDIFGINYYNMGMDVFECDRLCCKDITLRATSLWRRLRSKYANKITHRVNR